MNKTFNKPDLKASRYRNKTLSFLNTNMFKEFKSENPVYQDIDDKKLKSIITIYNELLMNAVIDNRDGVELPDSLGYIFIGTCPPAKNSNVDYSLSKEYGQVLKLKNWDTDGNIGKIFYTNWSAKYKFKNRDLWSFVACRKFKRTVAKEYPKNWTKYSKMKNKFKVAQLYKKNEIKTSPKLIGYNELEI
jgi:hypothetical protein